MNHTLALPIYTRPRPHTYIWAIATYAQDGITYIMHSHTYTPMNASLTQRRVKGTFHRSSEDKEEAAGRASDDSSLHGPWGRLDACYDVLLAS